MHRARRTALLLCAFALVAAQALGWMHRVVHAPGAAPPAAASTHAGAGPADGHDHHSGHAHGGHAHDGPAASLLHLLFAGHEDADCQLIDGLGTGAPVHVPVVLPAVLPVQALLQALTGGCIARQAALFDARGPPALR